MKLGWVGRDASAVEIKKKKKIKYTTLQFKSFNANYITLHKLWNQVISKSGTAGTYLQTISGNCFWNVHIMEIAECKKITSKKPQ